MANEPTGQPVGAPADASTQVDQPQAPTPIELREDSLIKVPGVEKPVKFSDHFGGLRSNLTKAQQEAADLRRQSQGWQAEKAEYDRKLKALVGAGNDAVQSGNKGKLLDAIKNLSYLTGQDAAQLFEYFQGQTQQFGKALESRDMALILLAKMIQNQQETVNQYRSQTAQASFEQKIQKVATDVGIPKRALSGLKALYLSYEQDAALDQEFPQIAKDWWEEMKAAHEEDRKARLDSARLKPFVPGKGGLASPSKPLDTSKMSNSELADMFFPLVQGGGSEG